MPQPATVKPITPGTSLRDRLTAFLPAATRAEQAIARYVLGNLGEIPFETGASLAKKVGVSELTIGRFCRALGYDRFKDLKSDLKDDLGDRHWLIADRLQAFQQRARDSDDPLAHSLQLEIASLVRVYEI